MTSTKPFRGSSADCVSDLAPALVFTSTKLPHRKLATRQVRVLCFDAVTAAVDVATAADDAAVGDATADAAAAENTAVAAAAHPHKLIGVWPN